MCKKIIVTLLTVCILAGAVVGIRALNAGNQREVAPSAIQEDVIDNSTLTPVTGSGLFLAEESDQLALYVSLDDGNIEVVNKQNGYTWRSRPTEEEMTLEKSNKLWKNNLQSPVMFAYTTSLDSSDYKYSNVFSQETAVTVYRLEKGVRVYFEFKESAVTFGYDICVMGDHVQADIPSYLISEPGEVYKTSASGRRTLDKKKSCLVVDFTLFPSLGATRSDMGNTGSLLVPDGMGALMKFDSDTFAAGQYISHVYGDDLALENGFDSPLRMKLAEPSVAFPVYGVERDGNTLLAVIDQGETQADIVASKAGAQTNFNTVAARFAYRMRYKVITNSTTGDGYPSYTSFNVVEPRRLCYYFGTGNYVDMAKTYRSYLMEKYGLNQIDPTAEPAALQLKLVGGDVESGMMGDTFIPMTTFEQAEEILRWFEGQGVDRMDVVYTGWAKRGESVRYPDRFPLPKVLGGKAGLTRLAEQAETLNARIYLLDDLLTLTSRKGVSVSRDAVYNIQNNPLYDGVFADPAFLRENAGQVAQKYAEFNVAGIQEQSAGKTLMSSYTKDDPASREQVKQTRRETLTELRDAFGSLRLEGGHAYALMDGVTLTDLEASSYLNMLDERVPFYNIALHGLVDYVSGDYMDFYEPRTQLLDAIAAGGEISFTLSWEGTEKLAHADTADYYSTAFALWREDVMQVWQEMADYLRLTRGQFITGHEVLKRGVTLTTYENGAQVLVNNTGADYLWQDRNVPARSFTVTEGGNIHAE